MKNVPGLLIAVLAAACLALAGCGGGHGDEGHHEVKSTVDMENGEFFTPQFKHHLQPQALAFGAEEGEMSFTTFYDINLAQVLVIVAIFVLFGMVATSLKSGARPMWVVRVLRGWCHWLRDEVVYSLMGEEEGKKWAPFFIYVFFFIAVMNVVGLVPGSVTATASIYVTCALALVTLAVMLFGGMLQQGPIAFWKNLLPHGLPVALIPLMALVEIVGLFVKPFALMVRLFANMLAGHLLIMSFVGLIFVFAKMTGLGPASWLCALPAVGMAVFINIIEALVVLLQAYIFTYLSVLFIQQSLHPDH